MGWLRSLAVLLVLAAGSAGAEPLVVAAGKPGGSYEAIARRLKTALILRGEPVPSLVASSGSRENLQRLADAQDRVAVALCQADALRSYLREHPDFRGELLMLGDMGRECALLVTRRDSDLRSLGDLRRGGGRLAVGAPGSGSAVTFETLVALEPAYAATQPELSSPLEALLALRSPVEFSELLGVLWVQRPRKRSPQLETVLSAPELYRFLPIRASELPDARLPDGSPVYGFERLVFGGRGRSDSVEVETLCTRALLVGSRSKISPGTRERLAATLLESGDSIVREDE